MKIYTGYFAKAKQYNEAGLVTISIARFNRYYSGASFKQLAPAAEIIHLPEDQYKPIYSKQLSLLSKEGVYNQIKQLSGGKDCILLCYEKPGDFCHRHMVASWLADVAGEIKEFEQNKLF